MILDYRNIPYEQLDSNIPIGRGMIKWMPFATMPEQYENVNQMIQNQLKKEYPKLTDDALQYNERMLQSLLGKRAIIRYWANGYEMMIECTVESIIKETNMIMVNKDNSLLPIYFYHIYEVEQGSNLWA